MIVVRRVSGFTLLEILVVIVIIGVILTLAAVKLSPDDSSTLQNESERLAVLMEEGSNEAIANGNAIGWSYDGQAYRFWRQLNGSWQPVEDTSILRGRQLPDAVMLTEARVNTALLAPGEKLLFLPSGVNDLFSIRLSTHEKSILLTSDVIGRVSAIREDRHVTP